MNVAVFVTWEVMLLQWAKVSTLQYRLVLQERVEGCENNWVRSIAGRKRNDK